MAQVRERKYIFSDKSNVYHSEDGTDLFSYCDGDSIEEKLLNVILESKNLSQGSKELNEQITDWPTRYHLSSQRADLLRPLLEIIKGAEVLEVGSGCGALTRYLGENGKEIIALEGSYKRAVITAARCRDLKNVKVYSDNFLDFQVEKKFDVVTLIGVLEYSKIYIKAEDPVQEMLKKAKLFLKPNGVLVIAIENQLGLKYFAGAPEDHLGEAYVGIENRYAENGPVTFGKNELERILNSVGFKVKEFLFAFPDYKFPLAIITNSGILDAVINVADILKTRTTYFQNNHYNSNFSEEETWPLIAKNNLIGDLANSFLIVASNTAIDKFNTNTLAYTFSNELRKQEFCKLNKFTKDKKKYIVLREKKYPTLQNTSKKILHDLTEEEYIKGELYLNGLLKILHQKDWNIEAVCDWFKPWVEYLTSLSVKSNEDYCFIDGKYFDASPFNAFILKSGKEFKLFDLEWQIKEKLRLDYVLFRTLYYSFNYIDKFQKPELPFYNKRFEIVLDILKYFFNEDVLDLSYYKSKEEELLSEIVETVPLHFFDSDIKYNDVKLHLPEHSIFKPLKEIMVQLFWKYNNTDFSESTSISEFVQLRNEINVVKYKIPTSSNDLDAIRFDIGNEVGFINIHEIKLIDDSGQVLWVWDKVASAQNDVFLIEDKTYWPGKIVQLAGSDDPYIIIKAAEKFNLQVKYASYIELSISPLDDRQFQVLKYFPSNLNYLTGIIENDQTNILLKLNSVQQKLQIFEEKEKQVIELQNQVALLLKEKNETSVLAIMANDKLAIQDAQYSKLQLAQQEQIAFLQNKLEVILKEKSEADILIIAANEKIAFQDKENSKARLKQQEQIGLLEHKLNVLLKEKSEADILIVAANEKIAFQDKENSKVQLKQQEEIAFLQNRLEIILKEMSETNILLVITKEKSASLLLENDEIQARQEEQMSIIKGKFKVSDEKNAILQNELKNTTKAQELLTTDLKAKEIEQKELKMQIQIFSEQISKLIDQNNILLDNSIQQQSEYKKLNFANDELLMKINNLQQNYSDTNNRLQNEIEVTGLKNIEIDELKSLIEKFNNFYEKKNFMAILYNKLSGKKVVE